MFHGLWRFWWREPFVRYFSLGFALLFGPFVYAFAIGNLLHEAAVRNWSLPWPIKPVLAAFQVLAEVVHVIGFFVLWGILIAFVVQRCRPREAQDHGTESLLPSQPIN